MQKIIIQITVSELYKDILQSEGNSVLPDVKYEYGNGIVSNKVSRYLMPNQVRKMNGHQKVTCGCEIIISAKRLHASLLLQRGEMNKLKIKL